MELNAHVRKGEKGSLVVYANSITRKETDGETGEEIDREIHFMKGYTVFNVEQVEGLPAHYYVKPEPRFSPIQRIEHAETFFGSLQADIRHGGTRAYYAQEPDYIQMPPFEAFTDAGSYYATLAHDLRTGRSTLRAWPVNSGARNGATKAMPRKNLSPSWVRPSCAPTSNCP